MIEITVKYKDKIADFKLDPIMVKELSEININAMKEVFSVINAEVVAIVKADKA